MAVCEKNDAVIRVTDEIDLKKTFKCGQCFRWRENGDGSFTGVAMGRAVRVSLDGDKLTVHSSGDADEALWSSYFDLGRDYASARRSVSIDAFMEEAAGFGKGIRILNQERWETLCSFILSQMNNIPRIMGLVEGMSRLFGDVIELDGAEYHAFPTAERVASLSERDLAPIKSGYRAPYVLAAARAVAEGRLDLEALAKTDYVTAKRELMKLPGVGEKVANCVILFSLRIPEAFPVDVWIKRSLQRHYPDGLDTTIFGRDAGLAQQYIFYYERENGVK